jgi:hypothetical protein
MGTRANGDMLLTAAGGLTQFLSTPRKEAEVSMFVIGINWPPGIGRTPVAIDCEREREAAFGGECASESDL